MPITQTVLVLAVLLVQIFHSLPGLAAVKPPVIILCGCADPNIKASCLITFQDFKALEYDAKVICLPEAKLMKSEALPGNALIVLDAHGEEDGSIADNAGTKLSSEEQATLIGNRPVAVLTCYSDKNTNARVCYTSGPGLQPMTASGAAFRQCLRHGPGALSEFKPELEEKAAFRETECETAEAYQRIEKSCKETYKDKNEVVGTKVKKQDIFHCAADSNCKRFTTIGDTKEECAESLNEVLGFTNAVRRPDDKCAFVGDIEYRLGTQCGCFALTEPKNLCPRFPGTWPFEIPSAESALTPPKREPSRTKSH